MIEVKNLTKKYGDHAAVKNLSFTVEKGRIYGFLGPNGAGKSTTMNIITGCLAATEGTVTIDGHDIFEDPVEAKKLIGYLPELPPLYAEMTPYEYLRFVAEAKGVSRGEIEDAIDEVMEETHITEMADRLIRNLSKGYRQRVGIAQAMLGNPEIIILDEPTVGLDPKQIIEIRDLIRRLGEKHTVILSSHILSEVSTVCDYVLIIAHGELVASDTLENLSVNYTGRSTMMLQIKAPEGKVRMILNDIPEIMEYEVLPEHELSEEGATEVKIVLDRTSDIREKLFFAFAAEKLPILSMVTENLSLEDVFLRLTKDPDPQEEVYEEEPGEDEDEEEKSGEDEEADDGNDDGDGDDEDGNNGSSGSSTLFGGN